MMLEVVTVEEDEGDVEEIEICWQMYLQFSGQTETCDG